MISSSSMSVRRFAPAVRLKVQLALARTWEALVDTYYQQAAAFVRRLSGRVSVDEALERFFRDVAVPVEMHSAVRARALLMLADDIGAQPTGDGESWRLARFDLLLDALRRRAQLADEIGLACRVGAAVAEEAAVNTHVRMSLEVAEAVAPELPPDDGLRWYLRAMEVPASAAHTVYQRSLAALADRPWSSEVPVEPTAAADAPALAVTSSRHAFGLRVIV